MTKRTYPCGLTAPLIADILGVARSTVYRWADAGGDRGAEAITAAWEIMTPEQRRAWLGALDLDAPRRGRGRPPKSV